MQKNNNTVTDRWNSKAYREISQTRVKVAMEVINGCKYKFRGDEEILDIGCGEGSMTAVLAKNVPHGKVIGLDLSKNMIAAAAQHFKDDNVSFMRGDAAKLHFKNKFDLITSFACLHWIKDQVAVLKGIENALKIGGQAILMYYPKSDILWDALERLVQQEKWRYYFVSFVNPYNFFSVADYKSFVKHTGLKIKKIEQFDLYIPDMKYRCKKILQSWLPWLNVLPIILHDAFMQDLMDQIQELFEVYSIKSFAKWPYPRVDINLEKTHM